MNYFIDYESWRICLNDFELIGTKENLQKKIYREKLCKIFLIINESMMTAKGDKLFANPLKFNEVIFSCVRETVETPCYF